MDGVQYIVDQNGKRLYAVLPLALYEKLLEELEDQKDVQAFDAAMAREQEFVPFDAALKELGITRSE